MQERRYCRLVMKFGLYTEKATLLEEKQREKIGIEDTNSVGKSQKKAVFIKLTATLSELRVAGEKKPAEQQSSSLCCSSSYSAGDLSPPSGSSSSSSWQSQHRVK